MSKLGGLTWPEIEALRLRALRKDATSVQQAAQHFATVFAQLPEVELVRLFLVIPAGELPAPARQFASALVGGDARLVDRTPTLSLLGSAGSVTTWNDPATSKGHRAIPLLDREFVNGIPMIARLLQDLHIDLPTAPTGDAIELRRMPGGHNAMFYVGDAQQAVDADGRRIIASREFVEQRGIRTVFGMGGSYYDNTLAVAILFCREVVAKPDANRFGSFIASFKMATSELQTSGRIFAMLPSR